MGRATGLPALLVATILMAAIALAGCGGGDGDRVAELQAALAGAADEAEQAHAARRTAEVAAQAAAATVLEVQNELEQLQDATTLRDAEAADLAAQIAAVREDLGAAEARILALGGVATAAAPAAGEFASRELLASIVLGPADLPPGTTVAAELYRTGAESGFAELTWQFDPGEARLGAATLLGFAASATAYIEQGGSLGAPQTVRDALAHDPAQFFEFTARAAGLALGAATAVETVELPGRIGDASVTWLMSAGTSLGPATAAYALVVVGPYVGTVTILTLESDLDAAAVAWLLEVFALKLATAPGLSQ